MSRPRLFRAGGTPAVPCHSFSKVMLSTAKTPRFVARDSGFAAGRATHAPSRKSGGKNIFVTSNNVPGFQGIKHLSLMKTFPGLAFVAAIFAFILLPLGFEIA